MILPGKEKPIVLECLAGRQFLWCFRYWYHSVPHKINCEFLNCLI